jgi:hypothetical protein
MRIELAFLEIRKVIIHEVPRRMRSTEGGGPTLSEVESELDSELVLYIKKRMIDSLQSGQSFDIIFDPSATSPVPNLVRQYTAPEQRGTLVALSQEMARHLYSIQTGANPSGLLVVIDCTLQNSRGIGILKLEREEGARIAQQVVGGKRTYDIKLLRDLILTEKTKVFKIGLFIRTGDGNDAFDAAASDHQRGLFARMEVADFFLRHFLGCKLTEEPEVSTKRFFEVAEEFINTHVDDPVRRAKYHYHLVSQLTSEAATLSPRTFAAEYLITSDRQKFLTYLKDNNGPVGSFSLDRALIKTRLEKRVYEFESGVSIVTPADADHDRVKLTKLESGEVRAEVQDFLRLVRGKS